MEMLCRTFGLKQPSSLEATMSRNTKISLKKIIADGRGLTVDQFLEAKKEFQENQQERSKLIKERESFVVFKGNI
jgi:hypothetical protein